MFPYKFGRYGQNYVSQQDYHLEYHTIAIKRIRSTCKYPDPKVVTVAL